MVASRGLLHLLPPAHCSLVLVPIIEFAAFITYYPLDQISATIIQSVYEPGDDFFKAK